MESDGGGVVTAAATTIPPRRLTSQHSTLRETFLAADLAESNAILNTSYSYYYTDNSNNFGGNPRPVSSVTLGAVLNSDKKSPPPNNIVVRTLLEIIRNDESIYSVASPKSRNRKSWKSFKERLKLKKPPVPNSRQNRNHNQNQNQNRNQNQSQIQNQNPNPRCREPVSPAPQSQVPPSSTPAPMNANRNSLRNSLRNNSLRRMDGAPADELALREVDSGGSPRSGGSFRLSAALQAEREETRRRLSKELVEGNNDNDDNEVDASRANDNSDEDEDDEEGEGEGTEIPGLGPPGNQPVRMSLMDLLEETDRQAGISGPTYRLDDEEYEDDYDEEEEEEEEEEEDEEGTGKGEHSCCVCMVRHKGAAFIPCGHTFCRLCSRELWVQRGNCPLCNNFILEILDIF